MPDAATLEPFRHRDQITASWYAVRTRSRQEKTLAQRLVAAGIHHYLPAFTSRRAHGGRAREVTLPLFPGYLFACGGPDVRTAVLSTGRAVELLEVHDQDALEHELAQIDKAARAGATFDPYPYLERGAAARVRRGPLLGLEGVIDERVGPGRLILVVRTLGQATSVEIDAGDLEPA